MLWKLITASMELRMSVSVWSWRHDTACCSAEDPIFMEKASPWSGWGKGMELCASVKLYWKV